jgi:hypothetical protein
MTLHLQNVEGLSPLLISFDTADLEEDTTLFLENMKIGTIKAGIPTFVVLQVTQPQNISFHVDGYIDASIDTLTESNFYIGENAHILGWLVLEKYSKQIVDIQMEVAARRTFELSAPSEIECQILDGEVIVGWERCEPGSIEFQAPAEADHVLLIFDQTTKFTADVKPSEEDNSPADFDSCSVTVTGTSETDPRMSSSVNLESAYEMNIFPTGIMNYYPTQIGLNDIVSLEAQF